MADKTDYDLIILGAGPAGMAAGVYAARKQIDMLILSENVGGQTTWSSGIENYLGYIFITGVDLVKKFEEHLNTFDVKMEYMRATQVSKNDSGFKINVGDEQVFNARAVIIATGKSPRMLDIPGEKEFQGRGVTYCATCDAPLFAGMDVAVIGGGNSGLDAVVQLMKICPKVYLIEIGSSLRCDEILVQKIRQSPNVEILSRTEVSEIHGDTFVTGITARNLDTGQTQQLSVRGVFVEIGLVPNSSVVKGLLRLNQFNEIPVDCAARTGVPGLYAAGDVTDVPEKQIIIAAGDGAKAALGAYSYLVRLPSFTDWGSKLS